MAPPCGGDPVWCIDFAALFLVEYLKDWSTLAMLAILLVLLLVRRAQQRQAAEDAYAKRLGDYDDKRRAAAAESPGGPDPGRRQGAG
jgi:hypothetical protein